MILERRPPPELLSLVIPCYNEEAVLPVLRQELAAFLKKLTVKVEIVLVDDGSRDRTLELLLQWCREDPSVRVLGLARNFGHQNAATAGLDAASGDAVILIDADLQDPLDVIPEMLAKYEEGYDVVYGQRLSRSGESWFKLFTASMFYKVMRTFVHPDLPADTGDFRLISRRCLDAVCSMHEMHRFLRGMITWAGFAQTPVRYHRNARVAGISKYPLIKMIRFAWNAIIAFSPLPLRISLAFGLISSFIGGLYGCYAIFRAVVFHDTVPGWTTQIVLTSLLGGAVLISNGILGEYVSKIFEECKGRPLYIVATRTNFPARVSS
ncbi:MAG: glycosyltransferase family 2 protein [Candidatus Methylacidiphilales bacterium]|nr:glycosyltransferase family 2 protein [Candidatus Methylacidiphilales bacterium]